MIPQKTWATNTTFEGGTHDPLPALVGVYADGSPVIETCWRMTLIDRLRCLVTGRVYAQVLGTRPQPMHVASLSDEEYICPPVLDTDG